MGRRLFALVSAVLKSTTLLNANNCEQTCDSNHLWRFFLHFSWVEKDKKWRQSLLSDFYHVILVQQQRLSHDLLRDIQALLVNLFNIHWTLLRSSILQSKTYPATSIVKKLFTLFHPHRYPRYPKLYNGSNIYPCCAISAYSEITKICSRNIGIKFMLAQFLWWCI